MKTIKFALAAGLFAAGFSAAPAAADKDKYAEPGKDTVEFCKSIAEVAPQYTVGDCMGILRSGGVPGFCKDLDRNGFLEFLGFKNVGHCVSTLRDAS